MRFKNILVCIFIICQFDFAYGNGNSKAYLTASDGTYYVTFSSPIDLATYNKILPINNSDNNNNYGIRLNINEKNKIQIGRAHV